MADSFNFTADLAARLRFSEAVNDIETRVRRRRREKGDRRRWWQ
ncbi:MAG: hypothetical protein WC483_00075 [Candidatus Paceibacterota bacterium]